MIKSTPYTDIYSGTEVLLLRLKDLLEQEGVPTIIQNDLHSGNLGGFFGGTPTTVRLKVREQDIEKARAIIENLHTHE